MPYDLSEGVAAQGVTTDLFMTCVLVHANVCTCLTNNRPQGDYLSL